MAVSLVVAAANMTRNERISPLRVYAMTRSFLASACTAVVASLCLLVLQAPASILLRNDANYVGSIIPGEPASAAEEVNYINTLIGIAANGTFVDLGADNATGGSGPNRDHSYARSSLAGPFDTASIIGGVKIEGGGNSTTTTGLYQYILAKYDGPNGGDLVWYFSGGVQLSDIVLPLNAFGANDNQYGLSHFSAYNPTTDGGGGVEEIPEPMSLVVWSLLGAVGIGLVRIRRVRI